MSSYAPGSVASVFASMGIDTSRFDAGVLSAIASIDTIHAALDSMSGRLSLTAAQVDNLTRALVAMQTVKPSAEGMRMMVRNKPDLSETDAVKELMLDAGVDRRSAADRSAQMQNDLQQRQLESQRSQQRIQAKRLELDEIQRLNEGFRAHDARAAKESASFNELGDAGLSSRLARIKAEKAEERRLIDEQFAEAKLARKHGRMIEAQEAQQHAANMAIINKAFERQGKERAASESRLNTDIGSAMNQRRKIAEDLARFEIDNLDNLRAKQQRIMDAAISAEQRRTGKAQIDADLARRGVSPGGFMAQMQAGFPLGGALQAAGVNIPMGLTGLLGRLEAVQVAMSLAFAPLAALTLVGIVVQLSGKLAEAGDFMTGFGEKARKAWDDAYQGSRKSLLELGKYIAEMTRLENRPSDKDSLASKLSSINAGEEAIKKLRQGQIDAQKEAIDQLGKWGFDSDAKADTLEQKTMLATYRLSPSAEFEKYAQGAMTWGQTVDILRKKIADYQENIYGLTDSLKDLERQKVRNMQQDQQEESKWRDRVHELPYKLPWFMQSPSMDFLSQLGPRAGAKAAFNEGNPKMPLMKDSNPIIVQNSLSAPMEFNGMPADAQRFLRDVMGPQLLKHLADNVGGLTQGMIEELRKAGIAN